MNIILKNNLVFSLITVILIVVTSFSVFTILEHSDINDQRLNSLIMENRKLIKELEKQLPNNCGVIGK